jgi:hypothetical protein
VGPLSRRGLTNTRPAWPWPEQGERRPLVRRIPSRTHSAGECVPVAGSGLRLAGRKLPTTTRPRRPPALRTSSFILLTFPPPPSTIHDALPTTPPSTAQPRGAARKTSCVLRPGFDAGWRRANAPVSAMRSDWRQAQERCELFLLEMVVVGKRLPNAHFEHAGKRDAVHPTVLPIVSLVVKPMAAIE